MPTSDPLIFLSAGETSGDLHGAALATALKRIYPQARLIGLAGPRMVAAGVQPLADFETLNVIGIVEVASRIPFFLALRRSLRQVFDRQKPDLFIPR